MKEKRLMIIHNGPLGSLTDSYKWCEFLKERYDITYIELGDAGGMPLEGIKRVRVSNRGSRLFRGIRYLLVCCLYILFFRGTIIVVYFRGCKLFKYLFPWKKFLLDIRTLSVKKKPEERQLENEQLRKACNLYGRISIIQEELLDELKVNVEHHYLPLGADVISQTTKKYDSIKLLYVGTLEGRRIEETIKGLYLFLTKRPNVTITYDIIGEGFNDTSEKLRKVVDSLHLSKVVTIHGRKSYSDLKPFFDLCNVGVSYIPITPWYDHQPPTKTFEYVMSGLFCIATFTSENKKIINTNNGILHEDNPDGFANALESLYKSKHNINFSLVKQSIPNCSWEYIVNNYLLPLL